MDRRAGARTCNAFRQASSVAGEGAGRSERFCIAATSPDSQRSGSSDDFKPEVFEQEVFFEADLVLKTIGVKSIGIYPENPAAIGKFVSASCG